MQSVAWPSECVRACVCVSVRVRLSLFLSACADACVTQFVSADA